MQADTPSAADAPRIHRIFSRWDDAKVLFECELPDAVESGMAMRHALEQATASGADLRDANLRGANLRDANLRGANLRDANLRGANLRDANLRGANLRDANLGGADLGGANLGGANLGGADLGDADLGGANLGGANLGGADLGGANLRDANLRGANLGGADLGGANLGGANLRDADLAQIKTDFFDVLIRAPREIAGLRAALVAGRVDGSTYEGDCACLVGTIANTRGADYRSLGAGISPDSSRPIERFFMAVRRGDTPQTNGASKIIVEWVDEFVGLLDAATGAREAA